MSDNDPESFNEQPIPVNIEDEMRKSYLDYAMSSSSAARCPTCATA